MERRLAAILAADVVGYSRLMAANEAETLSRLQSILRNLIQPKIDEYGGRIVKLMGDGLLADFASTVNAVKCAAELQDAISEQEKSRTDKERICFRVGINLGDIIIDGDDIFGDGVNVAARLEALAEPNGICLSGTAFDTVDGKVDYSFEDMGPQTIKNIAKPIRTYRLAQPPMTKDSVTHSAPLRRVAEKSPMATVVTREAGADQQPNSFPARPHDQPSLVVMPFDNLGRPDDEYFSDGVVEEITSALSRVGDFFVIARQSAFTYKGRFVDVREIGRELGVDYVVEGTVRRGDDRLRISVQLVDADTRTHLWSSRYEGALEEIFEFQDRIAAQVTGAILPAIRGAEIELIKHKAPSNLRAYDLVMRAYPNLWGRSRDANTQAIELLQKAIAIDPAYARAHALLAWCHASSAAYLWSEQAERETQKAIKAVEAAGSIINDPTALAAAGAAISMCGDQDRATIYIERALKLDPNNAWAWARSGWIAIYKGETETAKERFQRAMTLSPMDPLTFNMRLGVATALARSGSLDEAIAIVRDVIGSQPDVIMSYRYLAAWSALNGDLKTARWAGERLLAAQPGFTINRYRSLPFFRSMPDWADQVAKAMKLAGLPEG